MPAPVELLERERELAQLESHVERARSGHGSLALVEGPAGLGKTSLIRAVAAKAHEDGARVLSATGAELERAHAFGVVRQLFERPLRRDPELQRDLLVGTATMAAPIFDLAAHGDSSVDATHARLHGLFWLCANFAERDPLVLIIDDAHWADAPSLRFVDVLARRLEDLPIALLVGARPTEAGTEQAILDGFAEAPSVSIVRPGPLGADAIARLSERALGRAPAPAFVAAAAEASGGNPLFVRELLRAAAEEGLLGLEAEKDRVRRLVPDTLVRLLAARVLRLPDEAVAAARALAVLGDHATIARASELGGLTLDDAASGVQILVQSGFVDPARLGFMHPIVQETIRAGLPRSDAASLHRRAARMLADAGLGAGELGPLLLTTSPAGEGWAAVALAQAGRRALSDGAPDVAHRLLCRALEEPPSPAARPPVLYDLGEAAARIGDPAALKHLGAAAAEGDAVLAARAARLSSFLLLAQGEARQAVRLLRTALEKADELPADLAADLELRELQCLSYVAEDQLEYQARIDELAARGIPGALSHLAWVHAVGGRPVAEFLPTARRALADGSLLRAVAAGDYTAFFALEAMHLAEARDDAAAALRETVTAARRAGSPFMMATLAFIRPSWERRFGDLRKAEDELRAAVELFGSGEAGAAVYVARLSLAGVLLDRGQIEAAERMLADLPDEGPDVGLHDLHAVRARALAAREEWELGLREIERQRAAERARRQVLSNRESSGLLEVQLLVASGRHDEAARVADREVDVHARRGAAGDEAVARLARSLTAPKDQALSELRDAQRCVQSSPRISVHALVNLELGGSLLGAGMEREGREALQAALDLAHRCGATGIEESARAKLIAAGGRPRATGPAGADALTPAERRVAGLAADGLSNREIAETLFVTPKTVEVQLGRAYAKLGIGGRDQLPAAIGRDLHQDLSSAASG